MKFCTALFFGVLFCGCIDRLYAPNEKEEAGTLSGAEETEPTTADVANTEVSNSSEFPEENTPVLSDQVVSILSSSLSELEEIVAPTVAPATPTFDTESSSPSNPAASSSVVSQSQASDGALASVILVPPKDPSQVQSSESHQSTEDFFSEAVPTSSPEVLSFKLDSRPQVPISSAPTPTPPTLAPVKVEEDSITSALNQADEESKPKEEEEMPSFDEFKRRVLQEEEEKSKQHSAQNASRTQQKPKPKKVKERKQSNYASIDCGAKILQSNPEASNTDSILVENRDLYMLNPCSAKIWFIVELCDLAQVKSIEIANFELFSSTPESFRVYVSQRFPTREWTLLGTFQAREEREIQSFPLDEPIYAKYAKVEMLSHFGSEHYCPLSLLRVYGSSMMEELEDHERDGQEDSDSGDSDVDDAAQVLPREPGAETESGPQTQTLFERAAETVLSFVKKFTGSGENDNVTVNGSESSSESSSENNAQTKQGIVTLMGHDETEEKVGADDPVPSLDVSQEKTKVMGPKNDGSLLYKDEQDMTNSCRALTTCQSFAQIIRHSGLGCLVGGMLLSKKQKIEAVEEKLKVVNHTMAKETCDKSDSSEKEKLGKISDLNGKAEKENSDKEVNIQETPTLIENLEEKSTPSLKEIVENPDTPALTPSSSKVGEMSGVHGTVASSSLVTEMVDVLTRIVQPSDTVESVITDSQEKSDNKTPVLLEVSVVTSSPGNSTLSSLPYSQSSEIQVPKESDAELQEGENVQTSYESAKESSAKQLSSKVVELPVLVDEHKPSEDQDAFKPGLSSLADKAIPKDNEVAEPSALDQSSEATEESSRRQATQSECKAPNSLGMMSQSSPDIDVLETKLTDNEGREGTAELPKEEEGTAEDANPPKAEQNQDHHIKSVGLDTAESDRKEEPVTTKLKSAVDHIEAPSSVAGSQSTESTISSSKLNTEASDLADSVLPLPAPPLVSDTSSSSGHDIPISPDASLDKVQQGVTASAGAPGSSGSGTHKESIFVRLSNKIKALEQNLTLSTLYMEQLNQRYRKSLDEMQKNVDKKVALLTNATKKAELVINGQKEHISKLQAKVDELTNIVVDMKVRMDFLNKEVMERHIIGLCIEVILILFLFTLFRRRYYRQTVPDTPRGAGYLMNGHGPPRSANGSAASQEGNNLHTVLLSGREQLLRSFGKATEPETVGASATIDACNNKQQLKPDPYAAGESKKKRHRKRNKMANSPDATPEIYSCDPPSGPSSVVSRTAGLLFSNARGLLGGLTNPWKTRKTSLDRSVSVPSEENYFDHAPTSTKSPTMTRAKSLEIVPEETVSNIAPPPSPPPLPAQFGVALKRIPECYYSKKSNGQNIARGAIKYGKYGVLDTQLA